MGSILFDPIELGGISLQNRILRSATHEGVCDAEGAPTDLMLKKYAALAKGGVGAIIMGYTVIQLDGKSSHRHMNMLHHDGLIPAYKKLSDAMHAYNTPIIMQLVHCGRQTRSKVTGFPTVAPSAIKDGFFSEDMPIELSPEAIEIIIQNFVRAIVRAKKAGLDGVQLHVAHGYLLSMFLSSYTNRRTDQWGGSLENRFRIIAEILTRARAQVADYPIWVKMNAYDQRPKGMRIGESIKIAQLLETYGCNAIEVSCGMAEDGLITARNAIAPVDGVFSFNFKFKDLPGILKWMMRPIATMILKPWKKLYNYNVESAKAIKAHVTIPVIAVGGIHALDSIQTIIENKTADAVALSRPLIMEPNLVNKFKTGSQTKSRCICCDLCLLGIEDAPLRCYNGKIPRQKKVA